MFYADDDDEHLSQFEQERRVCLVSIIGEGDGAVFFWRRDAALLGLEVGAE